MEENPKRAPIIIVFGHEKGGTGKSTLCINTSVGLIYSGFKVGIIDTDMPQGTTFNFFKKREKTGLKNSLKTFCLYENETDSKKDSYKKDVLSLANKLLELNDMDFIIIDTAGSRTNFTKVAISFADMLLTPVNYSLIDIQMLFKIDKESNQILPGNYSEIVWDQKKMRILKGKNSPLEWYIIRNRISPIPTRNSEECLKVLMMMNQKIQYKVGPAIFDRVVYKAGFDDECKTIFDLQSENVYNFASTIAEMQKIIDICVNQYKKNHNILI